MTTACDTRVRRSYVAYGVHITSEIALSLPNDLSERDDLHSLARVEIVEADESDFAGFPASKGVDGFFCEDRPPYGTYLRWPHYYEFLVAADGARVAYRAIDGCDPSVFRNFLFGQVVGVALARQGIEPLHASVVAIDGAAVAFVGDCAYGKSTLLASFAYAGYRVVTDDMLIVTRKRDQLFALPGTGRLKLMPDSARRFVAGSEGERIAPLTEKRLFMLEERNRHLGLAPLRLLYLLPSPAERATAHSITIAPVSQAETARHLVSNTFSPYLVDRERLIRQFDHATHVASRTTAFALRYPAGLDWLPAIRESILRQARQHDFLRGRTNESG